MNVTSSFNRCEGSMLQVTGQNIYDDQWGLVAVQVQGVEARGLGFNDDWHIEAAIVLFSFDKAEQPLNLHNGKPQFTIHCLSLVCEVSATLSNENKSDYTLSYETSRPRHKSSQPHKGNVF